MCEVLVVRGLVGIFCWACHRRMTCAGVFFCLAAMALISGSSRRLGVPIDGSKVVKSDEQN